MRPHTVIDPSVGAPPPSPGGRMADTGLQPSAGALYIAVGTRNQLMSPTETRRAIYPSVHATLKYITLCSANGEWVSSF